MRGFTRPCAWIFAAIVLVAAPASAATSPFVKGPYVQDVTTSRAFVLVELDRDAPATIDVWKVEGPAAKRTLSSSEAQAMHAFRIEKLEPGTRYRYQVRANGTASDKGEFVTAPKDDSTAPVSFLAYGDNRDGDEAHARLVKTMLDSTADFIVNTGDFVADGANPDQWQTFFDIERPLLRDKPLFAAVGNHELSERSAPLFARYFGPAPENDPSKLYGTFRWGSARFFFLNAFHTWTSGDERDWLERALADADSEAGIVWRFVVAHQGPWSAGPHGRSRYLHEAGIPELLVAHHVDLMIAGHDHLYERGLGFTNVKDPKSALRYIVTGGGGAPLYRVVQQIPSTKKAEATYHFVELTAGPEAVKLVAKRADGSIIERCGFSHAGVGWDCDPSSAPPPIDPEKPTTTDNKASGGSTVMPADSGSKCGCAAPGSASRPPFAVAGLMLISLFLRRYSRS